MTEAEKDARTRIVLELETGAERIAGLISVGSATGAPVAERFSGYVELIAALEGARGRALPVGDPATLDGLRGDEQLGGTDERLV